MPPFKGRSQPPQFCPPAWALAPFSWEDRTGLRLPSEEERGAILEWGRLGVSSDLSASCLFAVLPWAADLTSLSLSFFSSVK